MDHRQRNVGAHLVVQVVEPSSVVFQVAVARPAMVTESLVIDCDGVALTAREVEMPDGGRTHILEVDPGRLTVDYQATVDGDSPIRLVDQAQAIALLRPSRYAESDRLVAIAQSEFGTLRGGGAGPIVQAVSAWVGTRLAYEFGSSGPTDGAVDTLLRRQGVCRDYAHLVIALLRGCDVPARLVAVYAPGLDPMDFHAVAEAAVDGVWCAVDATLLAPRQSLVRIATGRDAADTAFLSTYGGNVELLEATVTATVDGQLPIDNITELASIT